MMKLDELMEAWNRDSVIDRLKLSEESVATGKLNAKYLAVRTEAQLTSYALLNEYKEKREWLRRYWKGEFNNPEDLKKYNIKPYQGKHINVEIEKMIDGEGDLNKMLMKKQLYDEIVNFCDVVLQELRNRTFAIGNAIKMDIFLGGG